MEALNFLRSQKLGAKVLPGHRILIWPTENITAEMELWIKTHKSQLLAELANQPRNDDPNIRRAWYVMVDGKRIPMIQPSGMSYPEAIEEAQARFSHYRNVEVLK